MFYYLLLLIIPVIAALDQVVKAVIYKTVRVSGSIPVIENVFHISYTENTGAAFGIMKNFRWVFITFTAVVIVYLLYLLLGRKVKSYLFTVAACFVVAGGLGNLIDRVFRGYVIDYLDFRLIDFPLFNLADAVISVGTGLLCIYLLFYSDRAGKKKEGEGLGGQVEGEEKADN